MLFSEPKIPQYESDNVIVFFVEVSVLFSEPKIPQLSPVRRSWTVQACFSALQRAENSSIIRVVDDAPHHTRFSALQRAENSSIARADATRAGARRFSALQRAENSSMRGRPVPTRAEPVFQCSSASRKFLNNWQAVRRSDGLVVSVLFSEPKIPQWVWDYAARRWQ